MFEGRINDDYRRRSVPGGSGQDWPTSKTYGLSSKRMTLTLLDMHENMQARSPVQAFVMAPPPGMLHSTALGEPELGRKVCVRTWFSCDSSRVGLCVTFF